MNPVITVCSYRKSLSQFIAWLGSETLSANTFYSGMLVKYSIEMKGQHLSFFPDGWFAGNC